MILYPNHFQFALSAANKERKAAIVLFVKVSIKYICRDPIGSHSPSPAVLTIMYIFILGCYDDNDFEIRMIECSICQHWIHSRCEEMDEEKYQILSYLPDTVEFTCR